jgi:nitrogen fixation protein NifX
MSTPPISNEVALRIALASKVLPNISLRDLIEALQSHFEVSEITEESLSKLTVTQLKGCFDETDNDSNLAAFKEALRILWGETSDDAEALPIEPYQEGDLPNSIRIAVASNTGEQLDGHFGSCHRYLIYQLGLDEIKLIDVRSALEADLTTDKSRFRVDLIADCAIVYFVSIGGPAAAKVIQANIYPMKKQQGGSAREVLAELQEVLALSPPPWLAKILGVGVEERIKNYTAVN